MNASPKVLGIVLLLCVLTGCGGRPSEDDLSEALQKDDNSLAVYLGAPDWEGADEDVADCMAQVLHDSDLSDDALKMIADDELEKPRIAGSIADATKSGDGEFSDNDVHALLKIIPDLRDCQA